MAKKNIAQKLLEERCAYYEYDCTVSDIGEVTIVCPERVGLYTKTPSVTHRFAYVEDALLWMVSVMQKTNRDCRRYQTPDVWSYSDIAQTYHTATLDK